MSRVQTPEQFETAARTEVEKAETVAAALHQEIATLESRLNSIASNPSASGLAGAVSLESLLAAKRSLAERITKTFNAEKFYRAYLDANGKPILESFLREKSKIIEALKPQIAELRKSAMEHELAGRDEAFDDNDSADTLALNAEQFSACLAHAKESLRRNNPYLETLNFLHQIQAA